MNIFKAAVTRIVTTVLGAGAIAACSQLPVELIDAGEESVIDAGAMGGNPGTVDGGTSGSTGGTVGTGGSAGGAGGTTGKTGGSGGTSSGGTAGSNVGGMGGAAGGTGTGGTPVSCSNDTVNLNGQCLVPVGYFTAFNYLGEVTPGFLHLNKVTLSRAGTLKALGIRMGGPGAPPRGRLVLYDDSGAGPSAKVAETLPTSLMSGANHIPTTNAVMLKAGDYWVGRVFDNSAWILQDFGVSAPFHATAQSFAQAFPAKLGSLSASMQPPFNVYMLVE